MAMKLSENLIEQKQVLTANDFKRPKTLGDPPKDVCRALDEAFKPVKTLLNHAMSKMGMNNYNTFIGYGYLLQLCQNPLIRAAVEAKADNMTGKWGNFVSETAHSDKEDDRCGTLDKQLRKYKLQHLFRTCATRAGYFGGSYLFIDIMGDGEDLATPLILSKETIPIGSLRGFKVIDPYLVTPANYNSYDPMADNYYTPQVYYIQGKPVHASRLLKFNEGEMLPCMLRPAYNFTGISMAQRMLDAVAHYTSCRENAGALLERYATTVVKTDLSDILSGGSGQQLINRCKFFAQNRNNFGIAVVDKEREDLAVQTTSLAGITEVLLRAMEYLAAVADESVIDMWGISPAGFNTGDADRKNHNDKVARRQEMMLRDNIEKVNQILQYNYFGDFDSAITFNFAPLTDEDEATKINNNKLKAEYDSVLLQNGVIQQEDARKRVLDDPDSGYNALEELPKDQMPPDMQPFMEEEPEQDELVQDAKLPDNVSWLSTKEGAHFPVKKNNGKVEPVGKLAKKIVGGKYAHFTSYDKTKQPKWMDGKKITIPPAWTDVKISPDGKDDVWVTGKDKNGKVQSIQNPETKAKNAQNKFEQVRFLMNKLPELENLINDKIKEDENSGNMLKLMYQTGIRVGSTADTKAKVKAYGASTLEGRHIELQGKKVFLHFIGKKGVEQNIEITDNGLKKYLVARKKQIGDNGQVFDTKNKTTNEILRDFGHSLGWQGDVHNHNLRHVRANIIARQTKDNYIAENGKPTDDKQKRKLKLAVSKAVASVLGNTPKMAEQSYIDPQVWDKKLDHKKVEWITTKNGAHIPINKTTGNPVFPQGKQNGEKKHSVATENRYGKNIIGTKLPGGNKVNKVSDHAYERIEQRKPTEKQIKDLLVNPEQVVPNRYGKNREVHILGNMRAVIEHNPDGTSTLVTLFTTRTHGAFRKTDGNDANPHGFRKFFETSTDERNEKIECVGPDGKPTTQNSLAKHTDKNGKLTLERERLHRQIINQSFVDENGHPIPPVKGKKVYTFAGGGSGAGKSTVLNSMEDMPSRKNTVFIDSDGIKTQLPEYKQMNSEKNRDAARYTHEESSALAKRISKIAMEHNYNTLLDGTGDNSVESMTKKIREARKAGAKVNGIYVTCSTQNAINRSDKRAELTGRDVPHEKIAKIHIAVSKILPEIAKQFDNVKLYDTNGTTPILIATGGHGQGLTPVPGQEKRLEAFLNKANEKIEDYA